MFDSILIANRGEIARRIIRSAKKLGLRTIAVYSEADAANSYLAEADEAYPIGPAAPVESYLDVDKILEVAKQAKAGAIHPGYGFLSENAEFARRVEAAGMTFIGPTPEQLEVFGVKHTARDLASKAKVPLLPGSGLLRNADDAVAHADRIGLPVMIKASNGGGGIGMQRCFTLEEVRDAFERVERIARQNFGEGRVFLERLVANARHVEVQLFGDGNGLATSIGDRDCSLQRRNQKVIEECPAPGLDDALRRELHESARNLAASVNYRSAGTAEFIYDPDRREAYFLEMNTRLQVEHPVTEEVFGVDLVEQMIRLARGGVGTDEGVAEEFFTTEHRPTGHAVEARIYAEDPNKASAPSPGLLTQVSFPSEDTAGNHIASANRVRIDAWVETGVEVSPFYDPMLAKVIIHGDDRDAALDGLHDALASSRIDGVVTNLGLVRELSNHTDFRAVSHTTATLNHVEDPDPRIDVLDGGMMSTIQDYPGRTGYWEIGVPPSGPMDNLSFRLANRIVGNPESVPGLEITTTGPTLRFSYDTVVAVTGAEVEVLLDDVVVKQNEPIEVKAGQKLEIGAANGQGLRSYLAIRGGFDVPLYLGSASTFTLGKFGGHAGRALHGGDVLRPAHTDVAGQLINPDLFAEPTALTEDERPVLTHSWKIAVTEGPHEEPQFFTKEDIDEFYATDYEVHLNSARTGIRLIGPKPKWAREDGGEAGLHPSNIHDNAYAVGAIDFTGDTPIILGFDGPSLGGFVCPAVVTSGDLWKLGQLRPGDTVRFVPVSEADAPHTERFATAPDELVAGGDGDHGILATVPATDGRPEVCYRRTGDSNLLVEFGEIVLEIGLRMRVAALHNAVKEAAIDGVTEFTPGIRSLQIKMDPTQILPSELAEKVAEIERALPDTNELTVPSRRVKLPLSWDDPQTRLAIERYMSGVRDDAPWCPWNIEFIRRINGLDSVADVFDTVFNASYLVLGLGDVYLGAPVATPLDPRHRLVTTKYNPARTWTPENAVGIGGAYLCIYGMEGPGGYQFVGRTTQMWNRYRKGGLFQENPWALRFFDRIEWYPVSPEELLKLRAETDAGRGIALVEKGEFSFAEYSAFLKKNAESIAEFKERQTKAFDEEKQRWRESGEFDYKESETATAVATEVEIPEGSKAVVAPIPSVLWQLNIKEGDIVHEGDVLGSLEAMKMETPLHAVHDGRVTGVWVETGDQVAQGQVLFAIEKL